MSRQRGLWLMVFHPAPIRSTEMEDYNLLDATGKTVAIGSFDQMGRMLKHRVRDGRYSIVGPEYRLYCVRRNGVIEPDPDRVQLEAKTIKTIGELFERLERDDEE